MCPTVIAGAVTRWQRRRDFDEASGGSRPGGRAATKLVGMIVRQAPVAKPVASPVVTTQRADDACWRLSKGLQDEQLGLFREVEEVRVRRESETVELSLLRSRDAGTDFDCHGCLLFDELAQSLRVSIGTLRNWKYLGTLTPVHSVARRPHFRIGPVLEELRRKGKIR